MKGAIGGHRAPTLAETDLTDWLEFVRLNTGNIFDNITKNMDGFLRYSEENGVQKYYAKREK